MEIPTSATNDIRTLLHALAESNLELIGRNGWMGRVDTADLQRAIALFDLRTP